MIKSNSPYLEKYTHHFDEVKEQEKINKIINKFRKTVVIQGLGFVGSAVAAVLSNSKDKNHNLLYNVIGVDLCNEENFWKIARANEGKPPIISSDKSMTRAYLNTKKNKNFLATYSSYSYSKADIVVIDLHLDIKKKTTGDIYDYEFSFDEFKKAIKSVADNVCENTLVVVETTVPPGTTENIIYPIFKNSFKQRGLEIDNLYLAHAPERVMPGLNYLDSIKNYYRIYSGINSESKKRAKKFLESFIDTKKYPLTELHSTTASEMAKVMENSYRSTNIAFIQEWTEYAEKADVNLYDIINAIKVRPTHNNLMYPGFGVGGYCLTKDTLLADWSYKNLFGGSNNLDISLNAIRINDLMPNYTLNLLKNNFHDLSNVNLALLGVSYLNDVSDTRYTPAEFFYNQCIKSKINVYLHDPVVSFWREKNLNINQDFAFFKDKNIEILVFSVRHKEYLNKNANYFLEIFKGLKLVVDSFNIINDKNAKIFEENNVKVIGVGKAYWKK